MPKKSTSGQRETQEQIPIKVVISDEGVGDRIYCNHVEFNVNFADATMTFCEIDLQKVGPREKREQGYVEVEATPRVRIALPPKVFRNLARLMRDWEEKWSSEQDEV